LIEDIAMNDPAPTAPTGPTRPTEPTEQDPLSETELRALSILADMIIPASDEFGAPGAGDAAIVDAMVLDSGRRRPRLVATLSVLQDMAQEGHGCGFDELSAEQRDDVVDRFRTTRQREADMIAALTVQCYYRDDRVMQSLGIEPRPPHPLGYEVAQGDWSLLDPVRKKAAFFRNVE
jgi:hypothetical protein